MEKLLIKFIYFLLRYVNKEIASLMLFKDGCAKIAKGRYHTVQVEIGQHTGSDATIEFTAYIDGHDHKKGRTIEECLSKFNETKEENKVKVILD